MVISRETKNDIRKTLVITALTVASIFSVNLIAKANTVKTFNCNSKPQTYIAPVAGIYKVELWGAQGGSNGGSAAGGHGGYAAGTIQLTAGQTIYIYVGGTPPSSSMRDYNLPGYNGGGGTSGVGAGGGGATDIRIGGATLSNRVLVAGGGGGAQAMAGGVGGGLIGGNGVKGGGIAGTGGNQTSGGTGASTGKLGVGGNGITGTDNNYGGAGGGGYYGGGGASSDSNYSVNDSGGGGGSSYIGGVTNGTTIAGDSIMPSVSGGTETGHTGSGNAKITLITELCTVSTTSTGQGTVSGGGVVNVGTQITLTAVPYSENIFLNWTDSLGNTVSTEPTFITPVITSDVTYTANFGPATPSTPAELQQSKLSASSATISWNQVPNTTYYKVYKDGNLVGITEEIYYQLFDLNNATAYSITISAVSPYGESTQSQPIQVDTLESQVDIEQKNRIVLVSPDGSIYFDPTAKTKKQFNLPKIDSQEELNKVKTKPFVVTK